MEPVVIKQKRKGTRTSLTLNKKSRKYRERISDNSSYASTQSDKCSISNGEFISVEIETADQHTQTSSPNRVNVGLQIVPPMKHTFATQTEKLTISQSCETQYNFRDYLSSKQLKSEEIHSSLLSKLNENNALQKLSVLLDQYDQTEKFVKLIQALSSNKLKLSNISWKAALDMGFMSMCTSTTNMIYDREWLEFCQVLYHMFGTGVMNMLRGRVHFSHVTSDKCVKRVFKPYKGEFNFPVPSVPTLKKLDIGYTLDIPVGIIQHSLDLAQERAKEGDEFILSFDGKLVSPGCKDKQTGDCNMWGREGPPNIRKALKLLDSNLHIAQVIDDDMKERSLENHIHFLEHLIYISTCRLKCLHQGITGIFYLRKKLIANVGDNEELQYKYHCRMSTLNHNTAECESVVRKLLEINIQITKILSHIRGNADIHTDLDVRHINLSEQTNFFSLLNPDLTQMAVNLNEEKNSQYIKQGTDLWHKQRAKARVTGSTLHTAIGLDTLTKQKEHFHIYINGRQPPPPSAQLQKLFDHG